VEAAKIVHEDAKTEVLLARGHTQSYLRETSFVQNMEETTKMNTEKATIDAMIHGAFKPFVEIPEVNLWALQYDRHSPFGVYGRATRFKFLVLTGPSSLGKTQFAKNLFGTSSTLVVPCQGVKQPSLKNFNRSVHKAILFDEISSETIHDNKAVFQANNDIVLLGQSPCQEYVYSVFLYGVACIVCCNDWMEGIKRGSHAEEWLLTNSIVYDCDQKLYVD